MFTYSKLSIDSAIPLQEIEGYFESIGVLHSPEGTYLFNGLEIKVTSRVNRLSLSLSFPQHRIEILSGERHKAEQFLTNFRLRFLSAGG
jgi:hypothetical protein